MKKGGEHGTYKRTDGGNRTVGTRTKAAQTTAGREPQKGVVQERTDKKACAVGKHLGRDVYKRQENGDSAVPDVLRFFSTHHGYAGIDFIHKVNEINKKEIEDIKDKYDSELRKRVRAAGKSDGQVQPLAIIMTASHLINELLFCDGVELSYDNALACMTNSDTVDPSMRFYHSIENRFALNYDKFAGTHDSSSYDAYPENFRGGFWGVYKE